MSMTVKQLANSFGLKVGEFASVSGYSKQGLYDIIENGQTKVNKVRFKSFLDHLQLLSDSIHERDIAQARIEKNERDRLIEQLRKENEYDGK